MKKIKHLYNPLLTVVNILFIFSIVSCTNNYNSQYGLEIFPLEEEEGFGYIITKNHHIFIYQPFIPAVKGKYPFLYKEDARKVGNFIKQRLEKGEDLSVTEKDLLQLNLLSLKGY